MGLLKPVLAWALLLAAAGAAPAAEPAYPFKERYIKLEVRIPMRDGATLFTSVYLPRDHAAAHPILLERTPYSVGPYGEAEFRWLGEPAQAYARDGYILAFQDVRGRFQSQGRFEHVRPVLAAPGPGAVDETTDTYDSIEWLVQHLPDNNGRVGMTGASYPGFYAAAGAVRAHPALKAVSPQAPVMDWFVGDDDHRNGALCLDMFGFSAGSFGPETNYPATSFGPDFPFGTPDGYRYFLEAGTVKELARRFGRDRFPYMAAVMDHPDYDGFWQARNLRPHLRDIRPAVLTVGGWYDGEDMFGALACFKSIQRQSPGTRNHLVMGPWCHCQWIGDPGERLGQADWGQATGDFYRTRIEKPFFDHHLLGAPDPGLPKAWLFETGGNRWRRFEAWPPPAARATSFYLQGQGRLARTPPGKGGGSDRFVSDPAKPVPYTAATTISHTGEYLVEDQRFAATRPDVLVYESAPLARDLTVAGPVLADLWVATSGTDSDWVVKVIDVHPGDEPDPRPNPRGWRNGHWQELVRADVMRGKFRDSFIRPEPFVPGRPARVRWALNDVLHTFAKGHRIMVQVQCSWFPLVDRNPQVFTDINAADGSAFRSARQQVLHDPAHPSRIELGVLED